MLYELEVCGECGRQITEVDYGDFGCPVHGTKIVWKDATETIHVEPTLKQRHDHAERYET